MADTESKSLSDSRSKTAAQAKRRSLLEARLRKATAKADLGTRQTIRPCDLAKVPLSSAQQQLWILDRFGVESNVYTIAVAYDIEGPLDRERLGRALSAFVSRHAALRSRFSQGEDGPFQLVEDGHDVQLQFCSTQENPSLSADDWIFDFCNQGFSLEHGPVCAAGLLATGSERHVFCFAAHHAFFDGTSIQVFEKEFSELYNSDAAGDGLQPLPIQYGDYCSWEQQQLEADRYTAQLRFWLNQLQGQLPVLELPESNPRPAEQDFAGATVHRQLPAELIRKVEQFAADRAATPYMVLMACYLTVLCRYTGQREFVLGMPVSARTLPELDAMVGMMVNTLPLRVELDLDWDFESLLEDVKQQNLAALDNRDLPFDHLVAKLNPARDLSRTPIFQTLFGLREEGSNALVLADLGCQRHPVPSAFSRTDLSVWMVHGTRGLTVEFEYASAIFSRAFVEQFAGHFERALTRLIADPAQTLSSLVLMSPEEIKQVTLDFNQTETDFPKADLYAQFSDQASASPDAVAVRFDGSSLTYAEVEKAAAKFANCLRAYDPQGGFVGVSLHRNEYLPVVLLGILRAGFAYLPLDPAFPGQRLAFMLEDSGASVLVTQSDLAGQFEGFTGSLVMFDELLPSLPDTDRLEESYPPHDLAYLTYTSGSTGKPKGVMVGQAEVANFLHTMRQRPGMASSDTLLATTTLSFDISVLELFLPLTSGACVDIVNSETGSDGSLLLAALDASSATIMQATPATWRMLFEAGWEGDKNLTILCGGEALPPDLAARLLACGKAVWNMYGPTETTVWSACHQLNESDTKVVIGKPIGNTRLYVLDHLQQPVPKGVLGELYIGGSGVTQGYFGRPELTRERYLDDPFSKDKAARMYRTGDVVRMLSDGNLEYRHRADNQVKVRGFRIELAEIEATLLEIREVLQCAVSVEEPAQGDQRLVAYLVSESGQMPSSIALRKTLVQTLPAYMLPQHYVLLSELPRTPNGKIDRSALPGLGAGDQLAGREFEAPATAAEQHLASVWAEVLGIERVGRHDNFFELGGHSLLTLKVLAQLDPSYQFSLTPQSFLLENLQQLASHKRSEQVEDNAEQDLTVEGDSLLGRLKSQLFLNRSP